MLCTLCVRWLPQRPIGVEGSRRSGQFLKRLQESGQGHWREAALVAARGTATTATATATVSATVNATVSAPFDVP